MTVKTLNRSFAGGEISPQLFSRIDLDKFQTGMALCLNCEALAQGPVQNRAGFQWVLEAKYSNLNTVLIPFSYSTQQTFVLEFGHTYIRFHTNGATLLEPSLQVTGVTIAANPIISTATAHGYAVGEWAYVSGLPSLPMLNGRWVKVTAAPTASSFTFSDLWGAPISTVGAVFSTPGTVARVYEVATPYSHVDLRTLKYVQSADVLTLVSPVYQPMELRRLGATNWTLTPIVFATTLSPPQGSGAPASPHSFNYFVQGFVPDVGWTTPNAPVAANNDLTLPGHFNRISWTPISGATTYWIYKQDGANPAGLIGVSPSGNTFDDYGINPDTSVPISGPVTIGALVVSATAVTPASSGISVTPTGAGAIAYRYVVTSYDSATGEESIASAEGTGNNDLSLAGHYNTVSWPAVAGVSEYRVYRYRSGLWGFVGPAGADCVFTDENVVPDTSITPPIQLNPFIGEGNFPRAVSYHQQRRVFGGTINAPQTLWMTRSGTEKNLGYSIPAQDDDSVVLRVVSREANTIRSLVPMNDLILLTSGGEWKCGAPDGGAITPSNVNVSPQGYTGTSDVQPVTTDRTILFPQDRGGGIRELIYSWEQAGYQTSDVTILAPHLFQYKSVVQMAFSRSPVPSLWLCRTDGALLGMTYVPEHEIRAWHQHNTDGSFESVACVAEGDEDVIYAVVHRIVNARDVRYIERKHTRRFDTPADQFFVDAGLTYAGPAVSSVSGLYHLEGKTVSILADGGVAPQQVVVNGTVALDAPASKVQVGLPYVSRIKSLPLAVQTQAFGQGMVKNVNKVFLRVLSSQGFSAGPAFDKLRQYQTRALEPYGSPPDLLTGEVPLNLTPTWDPDGAVCFQQDQPLAFTLLGMTLEVATGS